MVIFSFLMRKSFVREPDLSCNYKAQLSLNRFAYICVTEYN